MVPIINIVIMVARVSNINISLTVQYGNIISLGIRVDCLYILFGGLN